MSVRLTNINLATVSGSTEIDTQNIQLSQCGWIEFLNESPYTVELAMGGINVPIPAWYSYPVQLQEKRNGFWQLLSSVSFPATVTPLLIASNLTQNISTLLLTTLYLTGETPSNTTPQPLARQTFVPNVVNNVSGTATNVQDDLRLAGSSTVEATVSGDAASSVTLTNNGALTLGNFTDARFGSITLHCGFGDVTIDTNGILTLPNSLNALFINALTNQNLQISAGANHTLIFTINGVNILTVSASGIQLLDATAQALINNSTITIPGSYIHVTCSANVTGIIMTAGTTAGQIVWLYNAGPGNLTFANTGSHVRLGSTISVNNGGIATLIWDGANWGISKAA